MHISSVVELMKQYETKEVEKDAVVTLLSAFTEDEIKQSAFEEDIKKEALDVKQKAESGDLMRMM